MIKQPSSCNTSFGLHHTSQDNERSLEGNNESIESPPDLQILDSRIINGVPHIVLTDKERLFTVVLNGLIGLCSSFSMPIYWPILPELAEDFHTSEAKINYTVTAYLVMQSLAPVFVSSLSDVFGRRPIISVCITGGIAFNVALACARTYWLMIFLRCMLAISVGPLVSITMASVGDISTKRNRGSLTTLTGGITLVGQAVSPFLGSVMATAWGWPAVFWFSAALEGFLFVLFLIFVPETNRRFVGNLGIKPRGWQNWSPFLIYLRDRIDEKNKPSLNPNKAAYNPWKPLSLVRKPSVFYILLPCSIQFATWTIMQTTMSIELQKKYNFTVLQVGLCFFVPGSGTIIGTLCSGRLLDYLYRRRKEAYVEKFGREIESGNPVPPLNIINCRLQPFIAFAFVTAAAAVTFGWCLDKDVHPAVILVMAFILTAFCMYPLSVVNTVLLDMFPNISGGVTALNNLFRCGMASIFVSCLSKMEDSLTLGGTYTLMMGLLIFSCGLIVLLMKQSASILLQASATSS